VEAKSKINSAQIVISRRRALQQASLAIGAVVAAPMMTPSSIMSKSETASPGRWAMKGSSVGKPAQESNGTAIKYGVLRTGTTVGRPVPSIIDGIPFLKSAVFTLSEEGGSASLRGLNIKAKHLYLSGCVNSVDRPHGNWGGTDDFKNQFVGDTAGYLRIKYRSDAVDNIPLIFGYTLWWRNGYNSSPEPFKSDAAKQTILNNALCVANGARGEETPYLVRIDLRDEPVLEIELWDSSAHLGYPVIDGITFADLLDTTSFDSNRFSLIDGEPLPEGTSTWLSTHSVASNDPLPLHRRDAMRDLNRVIYTFPDDIDTGTINRLEPVDPGHIFAGPDVKFIGPPEATILTNVFLENTIGLLDRVDDSTGMVHESALKAANYIGWVGYLPNLQAYYDDSYTRTHFIALLSNMGYLSKAEKAVDYFDEWMMYFPKSYPALQMGGKPVPGHATVIANKPHIYFDELVKVGWPTKFKTRDYGNPETDGHGLLMLSRWRAWAKAGSTKDWIDRRWEAVQEAAEWIPWCLDNPQLSLSEHGLLYAESEGGMNIESLYCNVPCYFGLLASAQMAEVAAKSGVAQRWRAQAARLLDAMNAYFPITHGDWGDIWDPKKAGGWGLPTGTSPIFEGMELYGYDAANLLPPGWKERSSRTHAMQVSKLNLPYCDPSALGYGQGFMTESALLLDRMEDATHMTGWMTKLCFAPRQPYPFRVPESAIVKSDGSKWSRGGDLGNGFQMGEVLLVCHILLGIDDYAAGTLKLMPRLPVGWTGVSVRNWPVRVLSIEKSQMAMLSMELTRDKNCKRCDFYISADKPIDDLAIRLGPYPISATDLTVEMNSVHAEARLFESGDSKWTWIRIGKLNQSCRIRSQLR